MTYEYIIKSSTNWVYETGRVTIPCPRAKAYSSRAWDSKPLVLTWQGTYLAIHLFTGLNNQSDEHKHNFLPSIMNKILDNIIQACIRFRNTQDIIPIMSITMSLIAQTFIYIYNTQVLRHLQHDQIITTDTTICTSDLHLYMRLKMVGYWRRDFHSPPNRRPAAMQFFLVADHPRARSKLWRDAYQGIFTPMAYTHNQEEESTISVVSQP